MRRLRPVDAGVVKREDIPVSRGERPASHAFRACTMSAATPACSTAWVMRFERLLRVLLIDADAAFDGDRDLALPRHGSDAVGRRALARAIEAGAEAALLHPIGRTADVEVDLVVAEVRGRCARTLRKLPGIRPTELERNRMFGRIERQVAARDRRAAPRLW